MVTSHADLMLCSVADLVTLFNSHKPAKPIGPKTFNSKKKLVDKLLSLMANSPSDLDVDSAHDSDEPPPPIIDARPIASVIALPKTKKPRNKGTGRTGRPAGTAKIGPFIMDLLQTDLTYTEILERVQKEFPAAKTSYGCLRWYAAKVRQGNGARRAVATT